MLKFGNILKAITNFETHQNLFKHLFTLLHFAMDDPVASLLLYYLVLFYDRLQ